MVGGWRLDQRESTKRAPKYRRGEGEIIIVNHDGRGWWDATGSAKGDVFNLIQRLNPSLNFGAVRKVLRAFVGIPQPSCWPNAARSLDVRSPNDRRPSDGLHDRRFGRVTRRGYSRGSRRSSPAGPPECRNSNGCATH